jgi:hypothetical protein
LPRLASRILTVTSRRGVRMPQIGRDPAPQTSAVRKRLADRDLTPESRSLWSTPSSRTTRNRCSTPSLSAKQRNAVNDPQKVYSTSIMIKRDVKTDLSGRHCRSLRGRETYALCAPMIDGCSGPSVTRLPCFPSAACRTILTA